MPELTIQQALDLALEHHKTGRLAEAEAIYQKILVEQKNNSDVLHLTGLIAHQKGQHHRARELITKAIAIDPTIAMYHSNLGAVLLDPVS